MPYPQVCTLRAQRGDTHLVRSDARPTRAVQRREQIGWMGDSNLSKLKEGKRRVRLCSRSRCRPAQTSCAPQSTHKFCAQHCKYRDSAWKTPGCVVSGHLNKWNWLHWRQRPRRKPFLARRRCNGACHRTRDTAAQPPIPEAITGYWSTRYMLVQAQRKSIMAVVDSLDSDATAKSAGHLASNDAVRGPHTSKLITDTYT